MKKYLSLTIMCSLAVLSIVAQNETDLPPSNRKSNDAGGFGEGKKVDSVKMKVESAYMWRITPRLGEQIPSLRDSALLNYHQSSLTDGKDVSVGYVSNIGMPSQSRIFFNRPETSRFTFIDSYNYWRKSPVDHLFLNSMIPYSQIDYQSGGGGRSNEERLRTELSTNFGKKVNVGFDFDYLYSRGFYTNLYNKHVNYDFYGSYTGDKYHLHAFFANNNFTNSENGGIDNPLYITDPDAESIKEEKFKGGSLNIPVRINDKLWNRLRGRHLFVSNRYDIGNNMEESMGTDSVMRWRIKEDYVSPASIIYTTHYQDQRRRINSLSTQMDEFYPIYTDIDGTIGSAPKYNEVIDDYMSYWSFKNTLAVSMNEGFRSWMKFGLAVFAEYDARKYLLQGQHYMTDDIHSQNALLLGGVLSSSKGKLLQYKAALEKDMLNSDTKLEGSLGTEFSVKGKTMSMKANAYIKNISPSFFEDRFSSKYWNWENEFEDTRRVFLGGEIESTSTKTKLSGGVETLQKLIYYNKNGLPAQKTGSVKVVSIRLDQKMEAGIFHWDNQIVYQSSSDDEALPLPALALYSNVYLLTKIAKVLTLQMGVDTRLHSKYYAPGYEPLTLQFYNQRERSIGSFPETNIYVNLHLKHTRFFVMMYNVAEGMGNSDYFSLHRYPLNPRILKLGFSWKFNN